VRPPNMPPKQGPCFYLMAPPPSLRPRTPLGVTGALSFCSRCPLPVRPGPQASGPLGALRIGLSSQALGVRLPTGTALQSAPRAALLFARYTWRERCRAQITVRVVISCWFSKKSLYIYFAVGGGEREREIFSNAVGAPGSSRCGVILVCRCVCGARVHPRPLSCQ